MPLGSGMLAGVRKGEIAFSHFSFDPIVRCNATAAALRELAAALGTSISAADRYLGESGAKALIEPGESTCVVLDRRRARNYSLSLPARDVPRLVDALVRIADGPSRAVVTLSQLGLVSPTTSAFDLEICKREVPELRSDYQPATSGTTWEAVVKGYPLTIDRLLEAREVLLRWCRSTSDGFERSVEVQTSDSETSLPPREAFERLLEPSDDFVKLVIWIDHPLVIPFSSRFDGGKCWFEPDSTELIISQHCVETGDYRVDIDNFLLYRDLLVGWVDALGATRVAWGDTADTWPDERWHAPDVLDDPARSWRLFTDNLEHLGGAELPRWVHDEFTARFEMARRLSGSR
jgi:hypothetical protein